MSQSSPYDVAFAMAKGMVRRWLGVELEQVRADHAPVPAMLPPACALVRAQDGGMRCMASVCAIATAEPGMRTCHVGLGVACVQAGDSVIAICGFGLATPAGIEAKLGCTPAEADALWAQHPAAATVDQSALAALLEGASATRHVFTPALAPKKAAHPFNEIVGASPAVREMIGLLEKVVKTNATVLIHGESGTGKELIARALHFHGPRAGKAFVVQNCSAFNDNLLESALFGHVKGAFTGAVKDQKGLFEVADGGTFFLDEIGDMSHALQVKLLRVLQEGTFTPVGGTKPVKVDVRIIAASHKDLAAMVARREFREDLFFRVNVLKLTVPPLRDRTSDIPALVRHFVKKGHKGAGAPPRISDGAMARLCAYPWPGNIRELENELERMRVLAGPTAELTEAALSPRVMAATNPTLGEQTPLATLVAASEREALLATMRRTAWNDVAAAAALEISLPLLRAKCLALGLTAPTVEASHETET